MPVRKKLEKQIFLVTEQAEFTKWADLNLQWVLLSIGKNHKWASIDLPEMKAQAS